MTSTCISHNYEINNELRIGTKSGELPCKVGLCVLVKDSGIWQKGKIVGFNTYDNINTAEVRLFDDCESQIIVDIDNLRGIHSDHFDLPDDPEFSFIDSNHIKEMIEYGYKSIQKDKRQWDYLRNYPGESLVWTDNEKIREIISQILWDYPGSHSGSSLSYVMKILEKISHIGFDEFKNVFIRNSMITRNDI